MDTAPEIQAMQTARWRAMSESEKLRLVHGLCADVDRLARVGIERDHPGSSEEDVLWHLAARRYGADLADAAFGPRPAASSPSP